MIADLVLIGLLVFCAGAVFADWCWRRKIRYKAETGIRLEADGKLYNITEDQAQQPGDWIDP